MRGFGEIRGFLRIYCNPLARNRRGIDSLESLQIGVRTKVATPLPRVLGKTREMGVVLGCGLFCHLVLRNGKGGWQWSLQREMGVNAGFNGWPNLDEL